jgi:4-amino-4-deoxy-L-arabinose transferase-like glycosyltransferase
MMLLAVIARVAFSLGISRGLLHIQPELESTDGYHLIAQNLFQGHGYRVSPDGYLVTQRAPAYPAFLLAIFSIAGVNYVSVQVAQALLGALSCWLLFLLGRWVLSIELGLAAAALYAIYPNSIEYSARLYAENVYFPIFLGFGYLLCRASFEGSTSRGLAAGAAWGASLLTRGTLLPLPFVLPIGIALSRTHRRPASRWLRWAVPALLGGALAVAPWVIRNYDLTGAFVPVSTWGWVPMYQGTQVAKRMDEWVDLTSVDIAAKEHARNVFILQSQNGNTSESAGARAVRYDQLGKKLILAEWSSDPLGLVKRAAAGLGFAWFFTFGAKLRVLSLAIHLPLFILFIWGTVNMAREHPEAFIRAWPALGLILFVNVFQAVAYPHVRYMAPAIALSFLFSALPLIGLSRRLVNLHRQVSST